LYIQILVKKKINRGEAVFLLMDGRKGSSIAEIWLTVPLGAF
jgi:hypothetical protein